MRFGTLAMVDATHAAATTLPETYYYHDMDGNRIEHSVNPGPQIACNCCGLLRFGCDFTVEMICKYCIRWYEVSK